MINETFNKVTKISEVVKVVIELYNTVNDLRNEIVTLKEEINTLRTVETKNVVHRNIENRKYDEKMIRYIFYLHTVRNISGYKIAKRINENGPFVYNILNRKIYSDINITDLNETDNITIE